MKRFTQEEPTSRASIWSRRLALFALALSGIAVVLIRIGAVDVAAGFAVLGAGFCFACGAILLFGAAMIDIWRNGTRGARIAWLGFFLAAGLLAYPGWLAAQAVRLPLIADITTDTLEPPAFSRSAKAFAARAGYVPPDPPVGTREAQRRAYPDIQPILVDLGPDEAFQLVLTTLGTLGWKVIDATRPGGRAGLGHIDAQVRSLLLGIPDDIAIRIRPLASQTRIDIRSASRFGRHDFGENAARIRRFAEELQTEFAGK